MHNLRSTTCTSGVQTHDLCTSFVFNNMLVDKPRMLYTSFTNPVRTSSHTQPAQITDKTTGLYHLPTHLITKAINKRKVI